MPENGSMKDFLSSDILNKRRQNLPVFYQLNGAIYLADIDYLHQYNGFFGPDTFAHIMPKERSLDIDTEFDLKMSELILSETQN